MSSSPMHSNTSASSHAGLKKRMLIGIKVMSILLVVSVLALGVYLGMLVQNAPGIRDLKQAGAPVPSVMLSSDGKTLVRFQREQSEPLPLDKISPYVIQALIATEDRRFYDHPGIDWRRCIKAVYRTVIGHTEGGSTLTQQLARNLFPEEIGRAREINRKVKEIITAIRIERLYTKPQILETYLNTAPFLYNAVGIEMAARTYFDKSASDLSVTEAATLVGMLKGTRYYNPVLHPERALDRRNLVLAQMRKQDVLSQQAYIQAREQALDVQFNRQPDPAEAAPHFAAHARKWLVEWAAKNDYDLYRDGLIIETTLDSRLQAAATAAVERQAQMLQNIANVEWSEGGVPNTARAPEAYARGRDSQHAFDYFWKTHPELLQVAVRESTEFRKAVGAGEQPAVAEAKLRADAAFMANLKAGKSRLEAGFIAIDPRTAGIKAWVGSRDFDKDQFDHVAQAQRQPGSTFKPIVYGAALELGTPPTRTYVDTPIDVRLSDGTIWRPTDMSGSTGQIMTLWEGLVYSKNVITTRVSREVGIDRIANLAQAMGISESKLDLVPSMALGTSPVTLLEMATVYTTIANGGEYRKPIFIQQIKDRHGRVIAVFVPSHQRVMAVQSAMDLIDMMRGVVTYGTGGLIKTRFSVSGDIAGKTGTTQNNTDGWFISMHPDLVAGAWVGFNDQRVAMRSSYWGQGGHNALRVVGDFLQSAMETHLLNTAATFPVPMRPPITYASFNAPPVGGTDYEGLLSEHPTAAGTGEGVIWLERDADSSHDNPVTTDPAGGGIRAVPRDQKEPPKSAEELGRVMINLGRDPNTGAPVSNTPQPSRRDPTEPPTTLLISSP